MRIEVKFLNPDDRVIYEKHLSRGFVWTAERKEEKKFMGKGSLSEDTFIYELEPMKSTGRKSVLTPEQASAIVHQYENDNKSYQQLADEYGVAKSTIRDCIKRNLARK